MHRCGRRTSFSSKRSLPRFVDSDRLSNQRLEGGLIDFLSLVDVDRAPYLSLETRASCGDQLETEKDRQRQRFSFDFSVVADAAHVLKTDPHALGTTRVVYSSMQNW